MSQWMSLPFYTDKSCRGASVIVFPPDKAQKVMMGNYRLLIDKCHRNREAGSD